MTYILEKEEIVEATVLAMFREDNVETFSALVERLLQENLEETWKTLLVRVKEDDPEFATDTAAHLACKHDSIKILKYLDCNYPNLLNMNIFGGMTVAHRAISPSMEESEGMGSEPFTNRECVKYLLQEHINMFDLNSSKNTPIGNLFYWNYNDGRQYFQADKFEFICNLWPILPNDQPLLDAAINDHKQTLLHVLLIKYNCYHRKLEQQTDQVSEDIPSCLEWHHKTESLKIKGAFKTLIKAEVSYDEKAQDLDTFGLYDECVATVDEIDENSEGIVQSVFADGNDDLANQHGNEFNVRVSGASSDLG